MDTREKVFSLLLLKLSVTKECCLCRKKGKMHVGWCLRPMLSDFPICHICLGSQPWSFWRHLAFHLLKNPKGKVGARPTSLACERTVLTPDQVQKACCSCIPHVCGLKLVVSALSVAPVHSQAALVLESSSSEHPSDWEMSWLWMGVSYKSVCSVWRQVCVLPQKQCMDVLPDCVLQDLVPYLPVASLPLNMLC